MKTQNAKSDSNINKFINGKEIRAAIVDKRKFYFVSDLIKVYGSGFINNLPTAPIVVRLTANGNSQTRRLVNVMEFKTALKQGKKTPTKRSYNKIKKVMAEQMELPLSKAKEEAPVVVDQFMDEVRLEEAQTTSTPTAATHQEEHMDASVEDSGDKINSFHKARMNMLKSDIYNWCRAAAAREEKVRNVPKEESAKVGEDIRREVYHIVYQEFDRVLAAKLGITVYQLANHKLGKKFRLKGGYTDTVEKAGHLDLLHNVAKTMFNK